MFGVASSEIGDLTGLAVRGPLCLSEEGEIRRMESELGDGGRGAEKGDRATRESTRRELRSLTRETE